MATKKLLRETGRRSSNWKWTKMVFTILSEAKGEEEAIGSVIDVSLLFIDFVG